jgi:hypothetical protein
MPNVNDLLIDAKNEGDRAVAQAAYDLLDHIFHVLSPDWISARLVSLHREHREEIVSFMQAELGFANLIHDFGLKSGIGSLPPTYYLDPSVLQNILSLLCSLTVPYLEPFDTKEQQIVLHLIKGAMRRLTEKLVSQLTPQVVPLAESMRAVLSHLQLLQGKFARVVLVEMPVGNSIPVKLLAHFLEGRFRVEVVRVSLSRNSTKREGVRKKDLLEARLQEFGIRESDLLVYVDEWFTGSNFNEILDLLTKFSKASGASGVLPVALMSQDAASHERYASNIAFHDKIAQRLGILGSECRFTLSPIPTRARRAEGAYFFWSEHDRTSGYRKVQALGALMSSIDQAVEELRSDPDALDKARLHYLAHIAEELRRQGDERAISPEMLRGKEVFAEIFEESYGAFLAVRAELDKLDHESNLGISRDGLASFEEICTHVSAKVEGSQAKVCFFAGLFHNEILGRISPSDRYYYRAHAPIIDDLVGDYRLLHELLMEQLVIQVEKLITQTSV